MQLDSGTCSVSWFFDRQHISKSGLTSETPLPQTSTEFLWTSTLWHPVPLRKTEECSGASALLLRVKAITQDRTDKWNDRSPQAADTLGGSRAILPEWIHCSYSPSPPPYSPVLPGRPLITWPGDHLTSWSYSPTPPPSSSGFHSGIDKIGSVSLLFTVLSYPFQVGLPDKI